MRNSYLEEIWAARRRIARQNGYSLRRTVEYLRGLEADYAGRVVSFQARTPDPVWLKPLPHPAPQCEPSETAAALREEPPPYGTKPRRKP